MRTPNHQPFKATRDELDFADCFYRAIPRKYTGLISKDAAIHILRESGFLQKQIREIWTVADRKGCGKVDNKELCALIRLAGWVQHRGVPVSDDLLDRAGPLPVLKGIAYKPHVSRPYASEYDGARYISEKDDVSMLSNTPFNILDLGAYQPDQPRLAEQGFGYPLMTVAHLEMCRILFVESGPIDGLLDSETTKDVFIHRLNAPLLLLESILNLVKTANRHSVNVFEFTLAAYFVVGIQSGQIRSLPPEVPRELHDQLWTPILLNPLPADPSCQAHEQIIGSTGPCVERPTLTSNGGYNSDLHRSVTTPQLIPVRKTSYPVPPERCPSISSIETKMITKLWRRVAKRVAKVSSTKPNGNGRGHVPSSEESVNGTIHSYSTWTSFEALERDSAPQPTIEQASTDIYHRFYTTAEPVKTFEPGERIGDEHHASTMVSWNQREGKAGGHDVSDDTWTVSDTSTTDSLLSLGSRVGEANDLNAEDRSEVIGHQDVVDNKAILAMLEEIKAENASLRLQVEMIHKNTQKMDHDAKGPARKSVHFATGTEDDLEDEAWFSSQMDTANSSRIQSLRASEKPVGPRGRNEFSVSTPRSSAHTCSHSCCVCRRQPGEEPGSVETAGDRHSISSSASSFSGEGTTQDDGNGIKSLLSSSSSSTLHKGQVHGKINGPQGPRDQHSNSSSTPSLPDSGIAQQSHKRLLRSILKVKSDRQRDEVQAKVGRPRIGRKLPSAPVGDHGHLGSVEPSGVTTGTLEAWNDRFITIDTAGSDRSGFMTTKVPKRRKLPPRPARELPTPKLLPSILPPQRLMEMQSKELPPLPLESEAKLPTMSADSVDDPSTSNRMSDMDLDWQNLVQRGQFDDSHGEIPSLQAKHSSMHTALFDSESDTSSISEASGDYASVFSHRHSPRTTLLTEIDDYNDGVVSEIQEIAPQFVMQVKKSLLRELGTRSERSVNSVILGDTPDHATDVEASPQYFRIVNELANARSHLRFREEDYKRLEKAHTEATLQHGKELGKLQRQIEEFERAAEDQRLELELDETMTPRRQVARAASTRQQASGWMMLDRQFEEVSGASRQSMAKADTFQLNEESSSRSCGPPSYYQATEGHQAIEEYQEMEGNQATEEYQTVEAAWTCPTCIRQGNEAGCKRQAEVELVPPEAEEPNPTWNSTPSVTKETKSKVFWSRLFGRRRSLGPAYHLLLTPFEG